MRDVSCHASKPACKRASNAEYLDRWVALPAANASLKHSKSPVAPLSPVRPSPPRPQLRCFEPGAPIFARFPSNNLQFKDLQIERLDRLIDPGDVFPRTLAPFRRVAHDIFVVSSAGQKLLIPAILLIHLLWLWSPRAALKLALRGAPMHSSDPPALTAFITSIRHSWVQTGAQRS